MVLDRDVYNEIKQRTQDALPEVTKNILRKLLGPNHDSMLETIITITSTATVHVLLLHYSELFAPDGPIKEV